MKQHYLVFEDHHRYIKLISQGEWTIDTVPLIEKELQRIPNNRKIIWDVGRVEVFDSAGVLLFIESVERFRRHTKVKIVGCTSKQKQMHDLLIQSMHAHIPDRKEHFLESVGKRAVALYRDVYDFLHFFGKTTVTLLHLLIHPGKFRLKETVYHIYQSGFGALMIIGLTAFLVGMVIAYQGAVQLAKFGADIFIVDTVGISITRELGPMITAIVIAGRSGSAYTAEIGAMKITEEIAAMRTMGFDPYNFLVLPRIIALVIALPLLIFFADIVGIFGGMVASDLQLGITFHMFTERLYEVLEVKHYILGMIKGPVFALIIAAIGCFRGFQVSDNTESIGLQTTASVVNSIFLVIAFDALFSVLYTELGL
ncbi:MAG: ABC transporter permease [Sulfurovum sp.]|nr:MAG: ABC transporter permease [Sulfurovum sp.]